MTFNITIHLSIEHVSQQTGEEGGCPRRGQCSQTGGRSVVHHLTDERQTRATNARSARADVTSAEHRYQTPVWTHLYLLL